ncbi:MAG: Slp family lipoprotein [Myxococcota bacterium]
MKACTSVLLGLALFVAGCVTAPPAIRHAPPGNLRLAEARDDISAHAGSVVRWGGIIISVENEDNETWIEVLEYKLTHSGRPRRDSRSEGRFLVRVDEFLDPVIYAQDREITAFGTLEGGVERRIGKQPYRFPVVHSSEHFLWKARRRYAYHPTYYYGLGFHGYYGLGFRSSFTHIHHRQSPRHHHPR